MTGLTFGQRIVAFRSQRKMLQKELAQKAEISPTALNYYEKDKREPNVAIIKRIANALDITGDELLGTDEWLGRAKPINQDETELLELYRNMNEEGKETLMTSAKAFAVVYKKGDTNGVLQKEA